MAGKGDIRPGVSVFCQGGEWLEIMASDTGAGFRLLDDGGRVILCAPVAYHVEVVL